MLPFVATMRPPEPRPGPVIGTRSVANGIYRLSVAGNATTPWQMVRATYADSTEELPEGCSVGVARGYQNLQSSFLLRWFSAGAPAAPDLNVNQQQWEPGIGTPNLPATHVATTKPLAATFTPGTNTLAATANGPLIVDGLTVTTVPGSDTVLVKDQ